MNGKRAWAAILVGVLLYNVSAKEGDLLSEQVDEWLLDHPLLTRAVVVILSAHLLNLIAPRYDLVAITFVAVRKTWWRKATAQLKDVGPAIGREDCALVTIVKP